MICLQNIKKKWCEGWGKGGIKLIASSCLAKRQKGEEIQDWGRNTKIVSLQALRSFVAAEKKDEQKGRRGMEGEGIEYLGLRSAVENIFKIPRIFLFRYPSLACWSAFSNLGTPFAFAMRVRFDSRNAKFQTA